MGDAPRQWTVLQLIDWTKGYFTRAAVEEPRLSAEVLLACALGCERVQLYTRHDQVVGTDPLKVYRDFVRRASAGEPIAYLTGEKEFYSLPLKVTPDVLVPRPETELLVDAALEFVKPDAGAGRMRDVCTGSGCVAVAAAKYAPALTVLATDISPEALAVAAENVSRHDLEGRIRLAEADLLSLDGAGPAVDVITANPPYVRDDQMPGLPGAVLCEPDVAVRAGPTGLECIGRILADAPDRLRQGGLLAMEIGLGQAESVYALLNESGRYEDIRFLKDSAGIERTIVALVK